MAKRNIFAGLLNPEHKPNRNAFDLSRRVVTSCKAGALVPVLCEDTLPGDYFEISLSDMVRTMPLNTAAFLRAKVNYEFYFVPYVQLWHSFPDFIFQREDPVSANRKGSSYQPNISNEVLVDVCYDDSPKLIANGATLQNNYYDRVRLLNALGYAYTDSLTTHEESKGQSVSPFRLAAYQKIWSDYYRNPWRDLPNSDSVLGYLDVNTYNFDDLDCSSYASSLLPYSTNEEKKRVQELTRLRYRGYKKDLFMGSLPERQFGSLSVIDTSGLVTLNSRTGIETGSIRSYPNGGSLIARTGESFFLNGSNFAIGTSDSPTNTQHTHLLSGLAGNSSSSFDVLALKQAEMLQLWKERTMRAGYRNQSQQTAHFGVGSKFYADEHPDFLGSFSTIVGIDEVISQANTSSPQSGNGNLGEIAGKGIGVGQSGTIKFNADTFGCLMCLMSVVPDFEYGDSLLDKNLVRSTAFDYYTPEFENLGMEPVIGAYLGWRNGDADLNNFVIGFAPRYYEYKTRYDQVFTAFANGGSLASWVTERRDIESGIDLGGTPTGLAVSDFYIDPANLDTIFAAQVSSDLSYDSDQFMMNLGFTVNAVRPMSVLGLPQW